jgi:FkbM family methyltransferase
MNKFFILILTTCAAFISSSESKNYSAKFEGIMGGVTEKIKNQTSNIAYFIPYNPIIFEIGAYEGSHTLSLSGAFPYGKIYAFEPNPRAFNILAYNTKACPNVVPVNLALNSNNGMAKLYLCHGIYFENPELEEYSSLLEGYKTPNNPFKGPVIDVSCVVLDDWCKENQIDHIDFLRLDTEGFELQILKSSPKILKTVHVIVAKTNLHSFRKSSTKYEDLKKFLESSGFVMLSHWYRENLQGEATFIQQAIYDALFK